MLKLNKANEYLQERIKKAKQDPDVTALEINSICGIPIELLDIEEERMINTALCSLLKSNGYITASTISDFYNPNDFYFNNKGYLIVF